MRRRPVELKRLARARQFRPIHKAAQSPIQPWPPSPEPTQPENFDGHPVMYLFAKTQFAQSQECLRRFQLRCVLEQPLVVGPGAVVSGELRLTAHSRQSYDVHLTLTAPPFQPGMPPQTVRSTLTTACAIVLIAMHSLACSPFEAFEAFTTFGPAT